MLPSSACGKGQEDARPDRFSGRRVGLDHIAFCVGSDAEPASWQRRLEGADIRCDRTDLLEMSILVFRDPDQIQIELCTAIRETAESSVDSSGTLSIPST